MEEEEGGKVPQGEGRAGVEGKRVGGVRWPPPHWSSGHWGLLCRVPVHITPLPSHSLGDFSPASPEDALSPRKHPGRAQPFPLTALNLWERQMDERMRQPLVNPCPLLHGQGPEQSLPGKRALPRRPLHLQAPGALPGTPALGRSWFLCLCSPLPWAWRLCPVCHLSEEAPT